MLIACTSIKNRLSPSPSKPIGGFADASVLYASIAAATADDVTDVTAHDSEQGMIDDLAARLMCAENTIVELQV